MQVSINREQDVKEVSTVTVIIADVTFRISVNKFDELVINKMQYGDGEGAMVIKPSVGNEIRVS